jgi:hypothetical protein
MKKSRLLKAAAMATCCYLKCVRPWHLRWGATDEELRAPMPGDDLVQDPKYATTRAITVGAPAEAVFPWLVQMGQGRGGLYSYDRLENLAGLDYHSADRIVPELQDVHVGDPIRLDPQGQLPLHVAVIDPPRAVVWRTGPVDAPVAPGDYFKGELAASWAFVVRPIDAGSSRLVVRWRAAWRPAVPASIANVVGLEPMHFVMERKMILGIRERAERLS